MKTILLITIGVLAFASCTQNADRGESVKTQNNLNNNAENLCFQRYSGQKNQDTASVYLVIKNNAVTGTYSNDPFEKDSRRGTIVGIKSGDNITGTWTYMQEGIKDSLQFEFELKDNILLQKQTSFDPQSGREFLTDTAAFSLRYVKVDCDEKNPELKTITRDS